jgi:hypothetical protein
MLSSLYVETQVRAQEFRESGIYCTTQRPHRHDLDTISVHLRTTLFFDTGEFRQPHYVGTIEEDTVQARLRVCMITEGRYTYHRAKMWWHSHILHQVDSNFPRRSEHFFVSHIMGVEALTLGPCTKITPPPLRSAGIAEKRRMSQIPTRQ